MEESKETPVFRFIKDYVIPNECSGPVFLNKEEVRELMHLGLLDEVLTKLHQLHFEVSRELRLELADESCQKFDGDCISAKLEALCKLNLGNDELNKLLANLPQDQFTALCSTMSSSKES